MLSLLACLAIVPVQDRAISVAEFIMAFDDDRVKHTASKDMGEHIIFVHAQDESTDAIKAKLAEALSASWRKTETGFRLERTQAQTNVLEQKEVAERAKIFKEYQATLESKLTKNPTAEKRANAALQSLLKFQESYRISTPAAFKPETELPVDWLLFALLNSVDAKEIASLPYRIGPELSDKPVGEQRGLPNGARTFITNYSRDRRELADFSQTILDATASGPMNFWVKQEVDKVTQPHTLERVIFSYGRSAEIFSAGLYLFDTKGALFNSAAVWIPAIKVGEQIGVPATLAAELNEVQRAFIDPVYGYSFVRDPHPEAIDKIMGAEPLCSTEPFFVELAKSRSKPLIAVLDDRLLDAIRGTPGTAKNVAEFFRKAEEQGSISLHSDGDWLILQPRYLLDAEARQVDRSALKPFLESTKKAGYITIEGHLSIFAAVPQHYVPLVSSLLAHLDRNGYVQVKEKNHFLRASRLVKELPKLRDGVPRETADIPVSSLSSVARAELWRMVQTGVATLDARPGLTVSQFERNANNAMPSGLPADAIVRITPATEGCVGLKDPVPNSFTAEELGWHCGGYHQPPAEILAGTYWYGERRGLRLEILLTPKTMLSNEYFESAGEMKEMRGYNSLPQEFRKQVEKSYEEMRKLLGDGT